MAAAKTRKHFVHVKWLRTGGVWMRLYNFEINSFFLQPEHRQWLGDVAVPFLEKEPQRSFLLVGFTSRTGTEAYNRVLAGGERTQCNSTSTTLLWAAGLIRDSDLESLPSEKAGRRPGPR